MEKIHYKCPKCGNTKYVSDQIQTTGGNFSKIFDIQNKRFTAISRDIALKYEQGRIIVRFPKRGNLKKAMLPESVLEVRQSWRHAGKDAVEPLNVPGKAKADAVSANLSVDSGALASSGKAAAWSGGQYTVLLSHDPTYFDSVVYLRYPKIDLTLSGHTHGMQVGFRINGKDYSPARFAYEHFSGMYIMANGQALYVNTGCGFNGIPFRIGMRPNLTLFSL